MFSTGNYCQFGLIKLISAAIVSAMLGNVLLVSINNATAEESALIVRDAVTAIAIADAAMVSYLGSADVARQRPLEATLKGGIWSVKGKTPEFVSSSPRANADGTVRIVGYDPFIVHINALTACITFDE